MIFCLRLHYVSTQIEELELDLKSTQKSLFDAGLRAEQSLAEATSKTRAESEVEISRLKAVIVEFNRLFRSEFKALSEKHRAFKEESRRLPRWYEKVCAGVTSKVGGDSGLL